VAGQFIGTLLKDGKKPEEYYHRPGTLSNTSRPTIAPGSDSGHRIFSLGTLSFLSEQDTKRAFGTVLSSLAVMTHQEWTPT
jgi:hypothetical protein